MSSTTLPPAAVLEELEKMLSSGTFRSASRSSKLLRFLVEQTLAGNAAHLKDYTLGAEALGRGNEFDPRIDPIARVEASRLRSRLELYYATEGVSDALVITLPRGSYVPAFVNRSAKTETATSEVSRSRVQLAWGLLAVITLIAVIEGLWLWRKAPNAGPLPEMRLEITTPPTTDPISLAISPDGQKIVFVATSGGNSQLWLRRLDSTSARPLAGTDFASSPFWSPDSRSVGFFADGKLKRIDIDGGALQVLARAIVAAGGTWNQDGVILFPVVPDSPLFRISAKGGEATPFTKLEAKQTGHRSPHFLPDGRHFFYHVMGSPEVRGIYLGDLGGAHTRRLLDSDGPGVYASSGHLLFVNQGTLFAQNFDPNRLELIGNPQPVAERLIYGARASIAALSASPAGPIAYRTGLSGEKRQFIWFDRSGKEITKIGNPESFGPSYLSLSADNRRLAVQRTMSGNTDIWLVDLARGDALRFTSEPEAEIAPIWSPGGDRVAFSSLRKGVFDLYQKRVAGGASEEMLATAQAKQVTDWSSDGRFLLFRSLDPESDWDIWALPSDKDRKPFPVVRTNFDERDGQFSPDGKWMAYQSNESGRFEIYLQPFPGPGEKQRISSNGGTHALWRRDGKELFYISLDGRLVSVPLRFPSGSKTVESGAPIPLFFARVGAVQDLSKPYAASPDGQRFLIDTITEENPSPITVILNWKSPSR